MTLPPRMVHGFLQACLLALLEDGPDYGLSLGQRLADAGLEDIPGGTLYPALLRLEQQGLVTASRRESDSGPPRKYFTLNDAGRAELGRRRHEWAQFAAVLGGIIGAPVPGDARSTRQPGPTS